MRKMKKTTLIRAPVGEVWKMFAYPENVLKIFKELKSYEILSRNKIGEGATYKWVVRYFGKDFNLIEKITEWKENKKLSGKNLLYDYGFNCLLEPVEHGTKITVEINYELPYSFLGKILDIIVVRWIILYLFHRSYKQAFENAKRLLSEGCENC